MSAQLHMDTVWDFIQVNVQYTAGPNPPRLT